MSKKYLPILRSLQVDDYGLYPGNPLGSGLHIDFQPGATLVLGANGLGKTTLIRMMFRLLTGPDDIPGIDDGEPLGFRRLSSSSLSKSAKQMFGVRVVDPENARATLSFTLGDRIFHVTRNLKDLSLRSLRFDDIDVSHDDEEFYKNQITESAGLASFGDFIMTLRYLVFYFEDRKQLVWDATAQLQICRILFLDPNVSKDWTSRERALMEADSDYRNKRAAGSRSKKDYQKILRRRESGDASGDRAVLRTLQAAQRTDLEMLDNLSDQLDAVDQERQDRRLAVMRTSHAREDKLRALEKAQFDVIRSRFPNQDETARYLLAHLIAEGHCLTCDQDAPDAADTLEQRIRIHRCIVCDTPLPEEPEGVIQMSEERLRITQGELDVLNEQLTVLETQADGSNEKFQSIEKEVAELSIVIADRNLLIRRKTRDIPEGDEEFKIAKAAFEVAEAELAKLEDETREAWAKFNEYSEITINSVVKNASEIKRIFENYLTKFVAESVDLT